LAPHTVSDLLYGGAIGGQARSLYNGKISIGPNARRANAYQANHNLLLSQAAKANTNPQLEIEQNDVRCTHGATVGPVPEEQLFYLRSRGIPEEQAKQLIVLGFFEKIINRISDEKLQQLIRSHLKEKATAHSNVQVN